MRISVLAVAVLMGAAGPHPGAIATAQTGPEPSLRFDVVSIRPSSETRPRGTPLQGGRLAMTGMTLRDLPGTGLDAPSARLS